MANNLAQYKDQMKKNVVVALNASAKVINETVLQLYKTIINNTPVGDPTLWHPPVAPAGYVPGKLRASWQISFDNIQRNSRGQFASGEQVTAGHGLSLSLTNLTAKKVIAIYNTQPYAERIEYGSWSTQAPAGMMRISIQEFPLLVQANAKRNKV